MSTVLRARVSVMGFAPWVRVSVKGSVRWEGDLTVMLSTSSLMAKGTEPVVDIVIDNWEVIAIVGARAGMIACRCHH